MKNKLFLCGMGCFLVMIIQFGVPQAASGEEINEGLEINTEVHWTASSSPYVISSFVTVFGGGKLVVDPGVEIKITSGNITVFGSADLGGTSEHPIMITNESFWAGFNVQGGNLKMDHVHADGGILANIYANGTASVINSEFENVLTSQSFIAVYDKSSLNVSSSTFTNIQAAQSVQAFNGSSLVVNASQFSSASRDSDVSVFDVNTNHTDAKIIDSVFNGSGRNGIEVSDGARLHISNSNIKNFRGTGLLLFNSGNATVTASTISSNNIGIESYSGNLYMNTSNIENNISDGIMANRGRVNAQSNWWGNASGPTNAINNPAGSGQSISDLVEAVPWSTTRFEKETVCCSSVLFIPGMEASRLYKMQVFENQLWEPNRNADVEKLYLNSSGESIDNSIYTKDVIKKTNVVGPLFAEDIYEGFTKLMDDMVNSKAMAAWQPAPYDWRMSPQEVVDTDIKLAEGKTVKLIDQLMALASTSKTEKVSIVAHSNGGLVTKALVDKLTKLGKDSLVDKIVFVGVPEFGAPAAIPAMLHGDDQQLGAGLILNKLNARNFAENMPDVYHLLPSAKYFQTNFSPPVISFIATSSSLQLPYGIVINDEQGLQDYLIALKGDRKKTAVLEDNTDWPNILNNGLIQKTKGFHDKYDLWVPPVDTPLFNIVGVGKNTIKGITYSSLCLSESETCSKDTPDRAPLFSNDGDGTVIAGNLDFRTGKPYALDLFTLNKDQNKNYSHSSLLNTSPIQNFITNVLTKDYLSETPTYISTSTSYALKENSPITYKFSVFSPVSILATDMNGNKTGLISATSTDGLDYVVQDIPNSTYVHVGEGKSIISSNPVQSLSIKGLDVGTFTFTEEVIQGDFSTSITFSDVAVTPLSNVTFDPVSDVITLKIDLNDDGLVDKIIVPDTLIKPDILELIRKDKLLIASSSLSKENKKKHIAQLNEIEKLIRNNKYKAAQKEAVTVVSHSSKQLNRYENKKLNRLERQKTDMGDWIFLYTMFIELEKEINRYIRINEIS